MNFETKSYKCNHYEKIHLGCGRSDHTPREDDVIMIMIFKTQTLIIIDDDIDIKKRSHSFYVSPYVQERRFSYHISRARQKT